MGRKSDLTLEQKQEIYRLYESGMSSVKIGEIFNKTASCIMGYITRSNIKVRSNKENSRRYHVNHDYFEDINNEEKAYWLGFIYADGYVTTDKPMVGISISLDDEAHLYKFRDCLSSNYPINVYEIKQGYKPGRMYCRILITSEKMKKDLIKYGCVPHKTDILTPPIISDSLIKHFIRGYMDGDGCITSHKRSETMSPEYAIKILGTDSILDYINEYIYRNLEIVVSGYYKRKDDQTVSCLEFQGNKQVKKFLDLIYEDSTIYLNRKHEKYLLLKSYYDSRAK